MKCAGCNTESNYIRMVDGHETCTDCGGFSAASGHKLDGVLTRNSHRVRRQQSRYEGDFVQPHTYNKNTRRMELNPDFVKLYPDKVKDYVKPQDMVRSGFNELPSYSEKLTAKAERIKAKVKSGVTFEGDARKAAERILQ